MAKKTKIGCKMEFLRADDFVEYFIFPKLPAHLQESVKNNSEEASSELLDFLDELQMKILAALQEMDEERAYIWHKDPFQLTVRTFCKQERLLYDDFDETQQVLPPHLHGITHYGDNVGDEWYIVFLLNEVTKRFPDCVARVIDSDGEFLLIEGAEYLPRWADPQTCEQRVYLMRGLVHLVETSPGVPRDTLMPVSEALVKLHADAELFQVSAELQECIDKRLNEYATAESVAKQQHYQIARLPVGIVAILRSSPDLLSAAVRAFCERDSDDNKILLCMRYFPPEIRMRHRVHFTRFLYAMITHTQYLPDRRTGWQLDNANDTEQYKEDLLGVKIACGFEILAHKAKENDNSAALNTYLRSLNSRGYFRGEIEGSQLYQQLYNEACDYFERNNHNFRTELKVAQDILELRRELNLEHLTREDDQNIEASDSDKWLNISEADFDAMLMERYGVQKLFSGNGDMNAEEFTKNMQKFLEKESGFDGITLDSDDDDIEVDENDGDADDSDNITETAASIKRRKSKNKAMERKAFKTNVKKNESMRRACKQNPIIVEQNSSSSNKAITESSITTESTQVRNVLEFNVPEDDWESNSDMDIYDNEDEMELNFDEMTNTELSVAQINEYMAQMDLELSKTKVGKSFVKDKNSKLRNPPGKNNNTTVSSDDDDFDDIESFEPININVNTLKNLIDSFKSQAGGPGPVSNLLNAMGAGMSNAVNNTDSDAKKKDDITESRV